MQDEKVLRNNKNFTTIDTNKNGVRFRDSKLEQMNSDYINARDQYQEHQKAVVEEIMNIAGNLCICQMEINFSPVFLHDLKLIAYILCSWLCWHFEQPWWSCGPFRCVDKLCCCCGYSPSAIHPTTNAC